MKKALALGRGEEQALFRLSVMFFRAGPEDFSENQRFRSFFGRLLRRGRYRSRLAGRESALGAAVPAYSHSISFSFFFCFLGLAFRGGKKYGKMPSFEPIIWKIGKQRKIVASCTRVVGSSW